ncbi:hypothetical protein ACIQUQ_18045 [Streptomyces sp. NPDC101118]|uniref:hypothetical protein n=1 Tax=Streptomyces sp. NPDC101118 TaxID=3366109 RepID=UPI003808660A
MTDDASGARSHGAGSPPAARGRTVLTGTRTPAGYPEGRIPAVPPGRAAGARSLLLGARPAGRASLRGIPSAADTLPFAVGAGERRLAP